MTIEDNVLLKQITEKPDLYAFTLDELMALERADAAIDTVAKSYTKITEQGKVFMVSSATVTAIRKALKEEGLNCSELLDMASDIHYKRKWYTCLVLMEDIDNQSILGNMAKIMTSDGKEFKASLELLNDSNVSKQTEDLELKGYGFLPPVEWNTIMQLLYIFEPKGEKPSTYSVPNFNTIRQGCSTNILTKMRAIEGKTINVDRISKEATITKGDLTLSIPNYTTLAGLKTSTHQLLDAITISLTETGAKSPTVLIPLSDYMHMRGLHDRKEAKKQVRDDIELLSMVRITTEERRGDSVKEYNFINIADSGEVRRNGDIVFTFGTTFFNMLKSYAVMPYPVQLQSLNNRRNPYSYYLLRKITEHKNMNIIKSNSDTIAVKTLLDCLDGLPKYEDIKGNGEIYRKIIEPFERDLDALSDVLKWEYCKKKGEPLSTQELDNLNYTLFSMLNIKVYWNNYPPEVAEKARQRKSEALENKKPAKKKGRKKKSTVC